MFAKLRNLFPLYSNDLIFSSLAEKKKNKQSFSEKKIMLKIDGEGVNTIDNVSPYKT